MAAHAIRIGHALRVKHFSDLVRLMAIHARRQHVGLFFPHLALDDFPVNDFNLRVTLRTGFCYVLPRDRRKRIRVRQDGMGGMAGCAVRRDNQAFFQQALPVDAFREIFENMILMNGVASRYRRSFLVTFPTEERHLHGRYRRPRISRRYDFMRSVTVLAVRRKGISTTDGFSMQRLCVKLLLLVVAGAAIHRRNVVIMWKFLSG